MPHARRRTAAAVLSAAAAGALVLLVAAPGTGAPVTLAQATATGIEVTVGGSPANSGTYRVTNDGSGEQSSGTNEPTIRALGNQSFLQVGTLAQDAATQLVGDSGRSVACAGLAGDGASLVAAGEGGCLEPGDNASINAGTLDLSNISIIESEAFMGFDQQLQAALAPVRDQVLSQLEAGLKQALDQLGLNVNLDLGAIQSQCVATPNSARGDSQLTDADLYVEVQGQRVDLLSFPTNPRPNTKVVTDLDQVVNLVSTAIQEQLRTSLQGALGPLVGPTRQLFNQINENLVTSIKDQLAPLEENVLDGTLNRQVRPTRDSIEVTALDLSVLPAANAAAGFDVLRVAIGRSTCGPSGRVVPDTPATPTPTPTPEPRPTVPTRIPAGLADAPAGPTSGDGADSAWAAALIAALLLVAGGAGAAVYRRALR